MDTSFDRQRLFKADPDNRALEVANFSHDCRIRGKNVLGDILGNREQWIASSSATHDIVIKEIARNLSPAFCLKESKFFVCNDLSHNIAIFSHVKSGIEFNLIPGGRYLMGSDDILNDIDYAKSVNSNVSRFDLQLEYPRIPRYVSPMLISRFPICQREWDVLKKCDVKDNRLWKGENIPVISSWEQTKKWLSAVGSGFRLPTEVEWEYCCRAGSATRYYWGSEMNNSHCWYYGSNILRNGNGEIAGPKSDNNDDFIVRMNESEMHADKTNAFGLVDMLGNVLEWCEDTFTDYINGHLVKFPYDWEEVTRKVLRGGSWSDNALYCRSASRKGWPPDDEHSVKTGFRVAISIAF